MHYLLKLPPTPWLATILFVLSVAFCGRKAWGIWRQIQQKSLGLRGERTVGQMLESLRAKGYHVFHDISEDGYNIDHVIIGPGGVFAIETKTRSKPVRRRPCIIFDGQTLTIDGHTPDRDPIVQAKAAASRVRDILKQNTGQETWVTPVVLFPGWFVKNTCRTAEVVVANEKWFLESCARHQGDAIQDEDKLKLLATGMERYLRAKRDM